MSDLDLLNEIMDDTKSRMDKSLSSYKSDIAKVRTGRANISLVESIMVDYYGTQTPLNQMASISIPEAKTIVIQPWDISVLPAIEKALQKSDLGITPNNDGKLIRLTIPILTEERRKELVKQVGKMTEDFRVSIRQVRKDSNSLLKDMEKEEHVSEDHIKRLQAKIQDFTDESIRRLNDLFDKKEKEIMEI